MVLVALKVYPVSVPLVNNGVINGVIFGDNKPPSPELLEPPLVSTGAASLFRWVSRWYEQTGEVWAATPYLSRRARRSERTIYRWLHELRQGGYLSCDVVPGIERRIIPLASPDALEVLCNNRGGDRRLKSRRKTNKPQAPKFHTNNTKQKQKEEKMSGVMSGVVSGVPPVTGRFDKKTTNTKTVPGSTSSQAGNEGMEDCLQVAAVAALISNKVFPSTARQLVEEVGAETVLGQVEALPHRKPKNAASVLVASIRGHWSIPDAVKNAQKAQKQAEQRQADRLAKEQGEALVRAKEVARAADLERRLAGMSAFEREQIEKQAAALWQLEQPGGFAVMSRGRAAAGVLRGYVARVLQSTAATEGA